MRGCRAATPTYTDYLYERLQRKGYLLRDCQRLVNNDRNHFAACMVALGDADAMVTGVTRNFSVALEDVRRVHRPQARPPRDRRLAGARARPHRAGRRHRRHRDAERARSSPRSPIEAAGVARRLGYEPRVALLAFSTFGHPPGERSARVIRRRCASSTSSASISNMTARWRPTSRSIRELMAAYPFCRLSGPANVLVMPAFHSASISTKMLQELGGATVIGPLLVGLDKPVQIVQLGAKDTDLVNMAALAAYNVSG